MHINFLKLQRFPRARPIEIPASQADMPGGVIHP